MALNLHSTRNKSVTQLQVCLMLGSSRHCFAFSFYTQIGKQPYCLSGLTRVGGATMNTPLRRHAVITDNVCPIAAVMRLTRSFDYVIYYPSRSVSLHLFYLYNECFASSECDQLEYMVCRL